MGDQGTSSLTGDTGMAATTIAVLATAAVGPSPAATVLLLSQDPGCHTTAA